MTSGRECAAGRSARGTRNRSMVLIELLAIVLAAVVLGVLALFRLKHDWDWGDMSVIIVGVVLA